MSNELFKDDTKYIMGDCDSDFLDHFRGNGEILN